MARLTITLYDHPADGSTMIESDPSLASLIERQTEHGVTSLSPAEGMAMIAFEAFVRASEPSLMSRTPSPSGLLS